MRDDMTLNIKWGPRGYSMRAEQRSVISVVNKQVCCQISQQSIHARSETCLIESRHCMAPDSTDDTPHTVFIV